jgi:hypothetical protein
MPLLLRSSKLGSLELLEDNRGSKNKRSCSPISAKHNTHKNGAKRTLMPTGTAVQPIPRRRRPPGRDSGPAEARVQAAPPPSPFAYRAIVLIKISAGQGSSDAAVNLNHLRILGPMKFHRDTLASPNHF